MSIFNRFTLVIFETSPHHFRDLLSSINNLATIGVMIVVAVATEEVVADTMIEGAYRTWRILLLLCRFPSFC